MAALTNAQRVTNPPLTAPRISLLKSMPRLDEGRWDTPGGIVFKPARYTGGWRSAVSCAGSLVTTRNGATPELVNSDFVDAGLFVVGVDEELSTFGITPAEALARIQEQLTAVESYEIAKELWAGGIIDTVDPGQRILRSVASDNLTVTTAGTGYAPAVALAIIEQGLAELGKGQRGMVHVTMQTLQELVTATAVRREGDTYLTASDNIVIADAGYPGTGPAGHPRTSTAVWMYGTSMVRLRLGEPEYGGVARDQLDQGFFDPSINDFHVRGLRPVLFQWDEAVHVAAETNLVLPLTAGAS